MTLRNRSKFLSVSVAVVLIAALTNAAVVPLSAASLLEMEGQRPLGGQASAVNTQVVVNGGIVNVTFDLQAPAAQTFEVTLEASQDGGRTYAIRPKTVSGDVGPGVRMGTGKRIVWDAAKDTDNLQLGELRFRVALKLETAHASTVPPSRTVPPPEPTEPPLSSPASTRQRRSILPAIGLIGGGVALSALALRGAPLAKCDEGFGESCFFSEPNGPIIGLGIGIAATGVILMLVGRGRASAVPEITTIPKGIRISRTIRF